MKKSQENNRHWIPGRFHEETHEERHDGTPGGISEGIPRGISHGIFDGIPDGVSRKILAGNSDGFTEEIPLAIPKETTSAIRPWKNPLRTPGVISEGNPAGFPKELF